MDICCIMGVHVYTLVKQEGEYLLYECSYCRGRTWEKVSDEYKETRAST